VNAFHSSFFFSFVQIKIKVEKQAQPVVATIRIHPGGEIMLRKCISSSTPPPRVSVLGTKRPKDESKTRGKTKKQVANDTMNTGSMQM
jgi:hypothetical protein